MQETEIIVAGDAVLDTYLHVGKESIQDGDAIQAPPPVQAPGGAATVSLAAASAGASCSMIDVLGTDREGDLLLYELASHGINTEHVHRSSNARTSTCLVFLMRRGHAFLGYYGEHSHLSPLSGVELGREGVLFADGYVLSDRNDAMLLKRKLEGSNCMFAFDPGPQGCRYRYFLERCGILLLNGHEFASLRIDPRALSRSRLLVVKQGSRGATLWMDGRAFHQGSPRTKVVNTVGAGDVFDGAFLAFLSAGVEPVEAVRRANEQAAFRVSVGGENWLKQLIRHRQQESK